MSVTMPDVTMPGVAIRNGVFVTGGSGFVGRRLLPELLSLGRPVVALDRSGSLAPMREVGGVTIVRGDLLEPDAYRSALRSCDVVIHLAAATGRASAGEHERVNQRGTEILLEECRNAGVAKILFVSSIAVTFPGNTGYHYADAKRRAEEAVSRSGLQFTILRPTIIVGEGAPNLKALERLALLPVIIVPGNGRVRIQPVEVDEVARAITETVRRNEFANQTVDIGGSNVVTMEAFLQQTRVARTGRTGRVVHIPLAWLRLPLRTAEAIGLGRLLPVTAGQLSSFRFDSVTGGHRSEARPATEDECRVFARYLLGCDPDAYVVDRYAAANTMLAPLAPASRFDETLLAFARISPLCARLADSYASLFFRTAALRKRLVLLLAILETRPPFHQTIDRTVGGPSVVVFARIVMSTGAAIASLLAGTLIFAPTRLVMAIAGKGSR